MPLRDDHLDHLGSFSIRARFTTMCVFAYTTMCVFALQAVHLSKVHQIMDIFEIIYLLRNVIVTVNITSNVCFMFMLMFFCFRLKSTYIYITKIYLTNNVFIFSMIRCIMIVVCSALNLLQCSCSRVTNKIVVLVHIRY